MIKLDLNTGEPLIMHIDLNSCFAIIEQQANPLYRNRPLAVAAYDSPRGAVLASSYEAKSRGVKLGVNVREAKLLCPGIIILTPDPAKYREAHQRFRKVIEVYTDKVTPKSIDEFVVDFRGSPAINKGQRMEEIGLEIKQRIKDEIGEYITVNVGIGTNRFWAKTAAGLHKPDGLDTITNCNIRQIFSTMKLVDLCGINVRFEARLNAAGIYTPLQFLDAEASYLKKYVFHSKIGFDWYCRLRGWEVDDVIWGRKSFGHTYALGQKTTDREQLSRLLMKLCEKVGRRLRAKSQAASGVYLSMTFADRRYWSKGRDTKSLVYATTDIFLYAQRMMNSAIIPDKVTNLAVSVYGLQNCEPEQGELFSGGRLDKKALADACDEINDQYGEFVITPALMLGMSDLILDRIAFGSANLS